eukprot:1583667-Amphidinium_carterae.1
MSSIAADRVQECLGFLEAAAGQILHELMAGIHCSRDVCSRSRSECTNVNCVQDVICRSDAQYRWRCSQFCHNITGNARLAEL